MKQSRQFFMLLILMTLQGMGMNCGAEVVDQNDRDYQIMISHLSSMRDALEKAIVEANKAKRHSILVGFNYERLIGDIQTINDQVDKLLTARDKRLRYQRLVPDSVYFLPKQDTSKVKTETSQEYKHDK